MSDSPIVSVVVPTHRRRAPLLRLLEALRRQTLAPDRFEVVVAIDGSDDGTREAVDEAAGPFVVRSVSQAKQGRASAVNLGVANARGEIVVILDDDMEPAPELLAAHAREHQRPARLGVVGAAPVKLDAGSTPFARFTGTRFNDVLNEMATRADQIGFAEAYTGNFSLRRADFLELNGFEAAFDGYGLEDYEFALRLTQAGIRLVLSSDAFAHQHYDKTFAAAARDAMSRGRSSVLFATLHPSRAAEVGGLHDVRRPSTSRRVFRYALPRLTTLMPIAPRIVLWSVAVAERCKIRRLAFAYELGLEYFYLLGMRVALREKRVRARQSHL